MTDFQTKKTEFIAQWGALGSSWGINRTMAQIHALLMISPTPLSTIDVMEQLEISRGNANTNLRELISWGLLKSTVIKGDRKEFFIAEKDVWKIFCIVARERKRREVEPVLQVLENHLENKTSGNSDEEDAFYKQMADLQDFVKLAASIMDKVAKSEQNKLIPSLLKIF